VLRIATLALILTLQALPQAPHIEGVGDWDIILMIDPATERQSLALTASGAVIKLSGKGKPQLITARDHDCRGKPLILSVDNGDAILLGESGRRYIDLAIAQILRGNKAVLAYFQEPCEETSTTEIKLQGFKETLDKANRLPKKDLEALEAQILAIRAEEQRKQAEARLTENPSEALMFAAREGDAATVSRALDAGADVNIRSETNGYTPLIWASSRGYSETVSLLLQANADPNLQATDGQSALMRASDNGHLEIVELLLDGGADVGIETERGITALLLAELKNHLEVAEVLKNAVAQK
jgi:hypothetical protein